MDIGKLAMWRLQNHSAFGRTWLSDYVPNRLGGFTPEQPKQEKPDCPLIGQDENVFNLVGTGARTLRRNELAEQAKEMCEKITACGGYDEALNIMGDYSNIPRWRTNRYKVAGNCIKATDTLQAFFGRFSAGYITKQAHMSRKGEAHDSTEK